MGVNALVILGHLGNAGVQRVGYIVQAAPVGGVGLDLTFQPGRDLGVGGGTLDEVGTLPGGLGVRLVVVGGAEGGQHKLALAVAAAHQQAHAHGLGGHGGGFLAQDLDDLFQREVTHVVLVQRVDDLHGGQGVARKAHQHIAVHLANLGQFVADDVGLIAGDRLLDIAAIADHGAEGIAADG